MELLLLNLLSLGLDRMTEMEQSEQGATLLEHILIAGLLAGVVISLFKAFG